MVTLSNSARFVEQLENARKLFGTTTSVFDEADSGFAPREDLYTVAGHIAHAADAIEWFLEGAFGGGWDLDLPASIARARAVTSLNEARAWLDRAFTRAIAVVGTLTDEELALPIADPVIMGNAPKQTVVNALLDHTAHHRGSLAVYARLVGKAPPMLYS